MRVTGHMTWSRRTYLVTSSLGIDGPNGIDGTIHVRFPTNQTNGVATISGTIAGHHVKLVTAAPWMPQG